MSKSKRKIIPTVITPSAEETRKANIQAGATNLKTPEESIVPKINTDTGTAQIGEKTYNFTKRQWETINGGNGPLTPEMEEYMGEKSKNSLLQVGTPKAIQKLQELANKENLKNWVYGQLGSGRSYSDVMKGIERGEIGDQPELLTKEQLESEIPETEKPENMLLQAATPFAATQQLASSLQILDLAKQWTKQIPLLGGIASMGKSGASTINNVNEAWDTSAKILNENIGKVKTGDVDYRDVLNNIADAQSAMLSYEGYIHGIGQADPDYRIDNGIAMELKLKQYQNALESYKLEVMQAENSRRMSLARMENEALYGGVVK